MLYFPGPHFSFPELMQVELKTWVLAWSNSGQAEALDVGHKTGSAWEKTNHCIALLPMLKTTVHAQYFLSCSALFSLCLPKAALHRLRSLQERPRLSPLAKIDQLITVTHAFLSIFFSWSFFFVSFFVVRCLQNVYKEVLLWFGCIYDCTWQMMLSSFLYF